MPHSDHGSEDGKRFPELLFIDAYDSFSNNIIALVKTQINAKVTIVKIDDPHYINNDKCFKNLLKGFDAVIAGPGPGTAENASDVGLISKLWSLDDDSVVPVLGVCLGFQSFAHAFGAEIQKLDNPNHGTTAKVFHNKESLFQEAEEIHATIYNSLHVNLHHVAQDEGLVNEDAELWQPSKKCPSLKPLAWVLDDTNNPATVMSAKHITKPFWGVQFHPESICTNEEGAFVMTTWFAEAMRWNCKRREVLAEEQDDTEVIELEKQSHRCSYCEESLKKDDTSSPNQDYLETVQLIDSDSISGVQWSCLPLPRLSVSEICETLNLGSDELVLLESATKRNGHPVNPETGRFTIIGIIIPGKTERLEFDVKKHILYYYTGQISSCTEIPCSNPWAYLKEYLKDRQLDDGPEESPFWGGLMGFVSYEACLDTIGVAPADNDEKHPDLCFAFIERSIVIDHTNKKLYVQSIRSKDISWTASTAQSIMRHIICQDPEDSAGHNQDGEEETPSSKEVQAMRSGQRHGRVESLDEEGYIQKIKKCLNHIRDGDSYELCLTEHCSVYLPTASSPLTGSFDLYSLIRDHNPAPFGVYVHLKCKHENLTVIGGSPERFLNWNRDFRCQFRPIKGTVKKGPGMTRGKAEAILESSKERAENLMIVDLIRHDLHGVIGPENVSVEKLMGVEEYETLYQLVSVIEGQIPPEQNVCGIDVLAGSLPPGSMTGAPKKRSCELLQEIEEYNYRGIYSGVIGYLDIGGGGDFSVVIRTAYKWENPAMDKDCFQQCDEEEQKWSKWHIGAGGAITSQSHPNDELEEMQAKREVTLKAFGFK